MYEYLFLLIGRIAFHQCIRSDTVEHIHSIRFGYLTCFFRQHFICIEIRKRKFNSKCMSEEDGTADCSHMIFVAPVGLQSFQLLHRKSRGSSARATPASDTIRGQSGTFQRTRFWLCFGRHHNVAMERPLPWTQVVARESNFSTHSELV